MEWRSTDILKGNILRKLWKERAKKLIKRIKHRNKNSDIYIG